MLSEELHDKLTETIAICDLHFRRMSFAWGSINKHFPLTSTVIARSPDSYREDKAILGIIH